jgi:hypothetical protein
VQALYVVASDLIRYARSYQLQRWNRNIPFTTAMLDVQTTVRPSAHSSLLAVVRSLTCDVCSLKQ